MKPVKDSCYYCMYGIHDKTLVGKTIYTYVCNLNGGVHAPFDSCDEWEFRDEEKR